MGGRLYSYAGNEAGKVMNVPILNSPLHSSEGKRRTLMSGEKKLLTCHEEDQESSSSRALFIYYALEQHALELRFFACSRVVNFNLSHDAQTSSSSRAVIFACSRACKL